MSGIDNLKGKLAGLAAEAKTVQERIDAAGEPAAEDVEALRTITNAAVEVREQLDVLQRASNTGITADDVSEFVGAVQAEASRQNVPTVVHKQDTTSTLLACLERSNKLGQPYGVEIDTTGVWNAIAHARAGTKPNDFVRRLREGMTLRPDGDSVLDTRALSVGTDTAGGYLVDDVTVTSVILDWLERSPMMSISRIIPTPKGESMTFPIADAPAAQTTPTNEAAAYNETDATISGVEFNAYKYTSISRVSDELLQDAPGVTEEAVRHALMANLYEGTEARFVQGSGSSQPTGVITNSQNGAGTSEATMGTIAEYSTAYNLSATGASGVNVLLKGLVEALYTNVKSAGASRMLRFVMPRSWYGAFVAVAFNNEQPAFAGPMNYSGMPNEMLLGVPVTLLDHGPALPASATNDNVRFGAVGVFTEAFGIRVVTGGMRIFVNPYRLRHQGQVEFSTDIRVDSKILLTDAIATIRGPTYTA